MNNDRIQYLLNRYRKNQCNLHELEEIQQWYESIGDPQLKAPVNIEDKDAEEYLDTQYKQIEARIHKPSAIRKMLPWLKIAAVFLIFAGSVFLYYQTHTNNNIKSEQDVVHADIPPGGEHATLTLSDGKTILLDSAGNGNIATQGSVHVLKTGNGSLSYTATGDDKAEMVYNTLATPRGGKYFIKLPDGTQVWLNAATTLKFPAAFAANERRVELTGEAYFEVARNAQKPFYVKSGVQEIKVLGTHFNVNSYTEEKTTQTTLLEGRVNVSGNGQSAVLNPGQAALLQNGIFKTINANTEQAVAWKDGILDMTGQSFEEVMRQVSRWYDVDIVYSGKVPDRKLSGQMDRGLMLSQILEGLKTMGFNVKLEGKKLIII